METDDESSASDSFPAKTGALLCGSFALRASSRVFHYLRTDGRWGQATSLNLAFFVSCTSHLEFLAGVSHTPRTKIASLFYT